eukprot:TRINITY_DN111910_c0_g1_i1.p1 TRINITY_DN111910_c0_g1~~TRINITY_DN111910_c0_g1_i1.p1  ORF type:complete len:470 (-),score=92.78 TRINITY_DN111910_c0_g1_i1:394-1803(-)
MKLLQRMGGGNVDALPHFNGVVVTHLWQWPWTPSLSALKLFSWRSLTPWLLRLAWYSPAELCRTFAPIVAAASLVAYAARDRSHSQVRLTCGASATVILSFFCQRRPRPILILTPASVEQASSEWLTEFVRLQRSELQAAVDKYGSLLFRGFCSTGGGGHGGLEEAVQSAEFVLESAGMIPTDFFGQAPRWQPEGWRYLFRNIAFEAAAPPTGFLSQLRQRLGLVWSEAPQYLTFHNEMAYLDVDKHLGAYGAFFCPLASKIGGFTPMSDARCVLKRLKSRLGQNFPTAMKWVLARKRKELVPKKQSGGYLDFLLGKFELQGVKDQFWPTRQVEEINALAAALNLEVVETDDEVIVWSRWISPERRLKHGGATWWCNGNHLSVGSQDVFGRSDALKGLPWLFRFADGTERPATMAEIVEISWAWWQEAAFLQWQEGDLVIFNNQVVAHNATPGIGARMVLPTFGSCWGK